MSNFKYGKSSMRRLKTVNPEMQEIALKALEISEVDISIVDGLRTAQEQNKVYKSGNSELDGYKRVSSHQTGDAIDVVPWVPGIDVYDYNSTEVRAIWAEVHRAFLRAAFLLGYKLELGVAYIINGKPDYPHIQKV